MNVAGLILAAGESRRMGSPKALLDFRGETFLDRLIGVFSRFCAPVVVVVGHDADRIRAGVRNPERVAFAENKDYSSGQFSSMQCGLRAVPETTEGVLFTLVDHPNVQPSTIESMLDAPGLLTIPSLHGRRGHPIYFRRDLISEFLALPADSQAKVVVNRHLADIRYVEVDDPGVLSDIDDPAAYRRLLETA